MQLILTDAASVSQNLSASEKAAFDNALTYVANFFDNLISNPITVNILVGYDQYPDPSNTFSLSGGECVGGGSSNFLVSYSTLVSALQNNETSAAQVQAYSTLPIGNPTNDSTTNDFYLAPAQSMALGLSTASNQYDGFVGFSAPAGGFNFSTTDFAVANEWDFVGVAEHEISHALGRVAGLTPGFYTSLDLFRY